MDGTVFLDWFKNLFLKEIPPERPVVLVFDGHGSHISLEIVKTARENGVIILKLPPNTTHVLKPLDVGVYGPAKTSWEKVLIAFAGQNLGSALKKEKFPCLIKQLWESGFGEQNVKSGFAHCGLCPFDPCAIPSSIFEATEVFQKPFQADINNNAIHEDMQPSTSKDGHADTDNDDTLTDQDQLSQSSACQSPGTFQSFTQSIFL